MPELQMFYITIQIDDVILYDSNYESFTLLTLQFPHLVLTLQFTHLFIRQFNRLGNTYTNYIIDNN